MGGGQVCLKWHSFHSHLTTGFKTLWEEDGLVDVTLASDGKCIRAHKLILSACSPFFRDIFKANPCQHPVIILQDTHYQELESLLCFVYKGEVNVEQENLQALFKAAETLQIKGLAGAAAQFQNELGNVMVVSEEEIQNDEPPQPAKRARDDNWQSPPTRTWQQHYSRTKKRSGSRNSSRSAPVSVETVLEEHLSPEIVPKLEPVDHELEMDEDITPILSDGAEDQIENKSALLLGPVVVMEDAHESSVSASDTGQNNDGPIYHVEQNLQSFESNQVFNCLTASKKDNPFPPFPCPFCERAYTSWGFRRRHIKAMHTHSQRLSCKWCLVRMETHMDWKKHVSVAHGLSPSDAHNGILILEEANMVLRIPNPQRLDTLVTMIKSSSSGQPGPSFQDRNNSSEFYSHKNYCSTERTLVENREVHKLTQAKETESENATEHSRSKSVSRDSDEDERVRGIKVERPDTPD